MLGGLTTFPRTPFCRSLLRRAALLVAFVCFWMSTGATLHHTDDLLRFRAFPVSHAEFGHATPVTPSTPCVAHQWMDAWQTLQAPPPAVAFDPLFLAKLSVSLSCALHLRPFDFTALRGPPAFSL